MRRSKCPAHILQLRRNTGQTINVKFSGRAIFHVFQRIVNRRFLPDYHDVIKKPVAFSTIRVRFSCTTMQYMRLLMPCARHIAQKLTEINRLT